MQQSNIRCCCLQDATTTTLCHKTNSSANMLRSGTASMPKMTCKYVQDCLYVPRGEYSKYAKDSVYSAEGKYSKNTKEVASVKEGHNKPLAKEGENEPLAKNGAWAGYDDELLTTRAIGHIRHARQWQASHHKGKWPCRLCQAIMCCIRAVYAMQGNDEPLTLIGDWAMTFNNREGTKALTIKLTVVIAIPHSRNEAP